MADSDLPSAPLKTKRPRSTDGNILEESRARAERRRRERERRVAQGKPGRDAAIEHAVEELKDEVGKRFDQVGEDIEKWPHPMYYIVDDPAQRAGLKLINLIGDISVEDFVAMLDQQHTSGKADFEGKAKRQRVGRGGDVKTTSNFRYVKTLINFIDYKWPIYKLQGAGTKPKINASVEEKMKKEYRFYYSETGVRYRGMREHIPAGYFDVMRDQADDICSRFLVDLTIDIATRKAIAVAAASVFARLQGFLSARAKYSEVATRLDILEKSVRIQNRGSKRIMERYVPWPTIIAKTKEAIASDHKPSTKDWLLWAVNVLIPPRRTKDWTLMRITDSQTVDEVLTGDSTYYNWLVHTKEGWVYVGNQFKTRNDLGPFVAWIPPKSLLGESVAAYVDKYPGDVAEERFVFEPPKDQKKSTSKPPTHQQYIDMLYRMGQSILGRSRETAPSSQTFRRSFISWAWPHKYVDKTMSIIQKQRLAYLMGHSVGTAATYETLTDSPEPPAELLEDGTYVPAEGLDEPLYGDKGYFPLFLGIPALSVRTDILQGFGIPESEILAERYKLHALHGRSGTTPAGGLGGENRQLINALASGVQLVAEQPPIDFNAKVDVEDTPVRPAARIAIDDSKILKPRKIEPEGFVDWLNTKKGQGTYEKSDSGYRAQQRQQYRKWVVANDSGAKRKSAKSAKSAAAKRQRTVEPAKPAKSRGKAEAKPEAPTRTVTTRSTSGRSG